MQIPTERLLEALDLESLSPGEQEELLLEMGDLLYQGTMLRIVERMDDVTREEFEALMESDADEDAVEAFLKERVPDADQAVEEAVAELQDAILEETGTN